MRDLFRTADEAGMSGLPVLFVTRMSLRNGGRGAPSPGEGGVWRCRRRIGWQGNQAPAQQAPWTVPAPRRGGEAFSVKGMSSHAPFTREQARAAGVRIGIDWETSLFSLEQFRMGMDVELEHGTRDPATNVTDDDVLMTAKIARAHLNEFPDYYTRLAKMEAEAEADWTTPGDWRGAWPPGRVALPSASAAAIAAPGQGFARLAGHQGGGDIRMRLNPQGRPRTYSAAGASITSSPSSSTSRPVNTSQVRRCPGRVP